MESLMWEKINNFLKGQIVTSIIYIALGACLAFMPVNTINVICKFIFGILLILVGFYHILIYILEKLNSTILDLFSGGVLMVIGIFLFMNPQIVVKLLPILLGTFILVDSIWSLKGSLKLKKRGSGAWKFLLIGSLIFIGLGISLVINPFTMVKYTVIFAGWIFLCNGVVDLIYLILLRCGLKELKQEAEAVDADSEIISDDAESSAQPEEPVVPEYAPWSSRRKAEPADDLSDSEEETSDKEPFDSNAYDREVSGMEESLDVVQVREEEVPLDESTEEMTEQENDPPAARGAYVVSKPTVTDDDLSDTKDENLLGLISRKRKKNKSE